MIENDIDNHKENGSFKEIPQLNLNMHSDDDDFADYELYTNNDTKAKDTIDKGDLSVYNDNKKSNNLSDNCDSSHDDKDDEDEEEEDEEEEDEEEGDEEEEEEEEDDDDEEDDDEEDDTPPHFKYKRITGLPPRFFNNDPISTCYVNSNFYIFATHSGIMLFCDLNFKTIKMFKAHTSSILCLDYDGEYFASCSMDGTVIIGLMTKSNNTFIINDLDMVKFNFQRPIHAISLNKPYSKTKGFFCGGTSGNVIHCSRNWLNQRVDKIIDKDGGCITLIKSENDLLIWCNNKGITISQISTQKQLLHLDVPASITRPELYWPKLQFIDDDGLIIGWLDHVWSLKILNSKVSTSGSSNHNNILNSAASTFTQSYEEKKIEILFNKRLSDCMIAGISEYNHTLLILNYLPKVGKNQYFPPELKLLDNFSFEEISVEGLLIKNFEGLGINDYQLLEANYMHIDDRKWVLISPNDSIIIEPYNMNDKITWFVENNRFFEAWKISEPWISKWERLDIGEKYLKNLIDSNFWVDAMNFLPKLLELPDVEETDSYEYETKVVAKWNFWLNFLYEKRILTLYYKILPINPFNCAEQIKPEYYEVILHDLLRQKQYTIFINLLNNWNHSLFDVKDIQLDLNELLEESNDSEDLKDLREVYISLSLELDEPNNCVKQMIILQNDKLMEFLDEHHLLTSYLNKLPEIILIGVNEVFIKEKNYIKLKENSRLFENIQILVENVHEILPVKIIEIFKAAKLDIINYFYLKELRKVDNILVKDFEDEIISLFAEFNKDELYDFLKNHKKYSIDNAIKVCEGYEYYDELVYLLSKIGDNKKALSLIIDKMEDPNKAISFVSSVNDQELWDFLLDYSMNKSKFVKELLINVGSLVDPIPVVSRIPKGISIDNLKGILIDITRNISLDKEIYDIVLQIISNEYMDKNDKLRNTKLKGTLINEKELKIIDENIDSTYLRIQENGKDKFLKEADVIGEKWNGDRKNKIAHKSFLKYKLSL
jgi:hypothetical protein